jgi:hypothetical protein
MTKEEIAELIEALPQGLDADDFIYKLVNWAVDIEREKCALICENMERNGAWITKAEASTAIRARCIDVARVGEVGAWGEK